MKPNSTVEELASWGGQELRQAGVPAPRNEAEYFLAQCIQHTILDIRGSAEMGAVGAIIEEVIYDLGMQ